MPLVETEHVLVTPTELFHQIGHFQGFTADVDRYLARLLAPEHTSYRPRGDMEHDPSFKQLIPYVIFRWVDAAGDVHIFEYQRGGGQGEVRLRAKRSVGIGGHISAVDAISSERCPYEQGMRRELAEEVRIDTPHRFSCVGLINDDQTEVGRVHLGVVHVCDVDEPRVEPAEADILARGFRPLSDLLADMDGFETWSRICLEEFLARR